MSVHHSQCNYHYQSTKQPPEIMRLSSIFRQCHQDNTDTLLSSSLLLCIECKWRQSDSQRQTGKEMAWTIIKVWMCNQREKWGEKRKNIQEGETKMQQTKDENWLKKKGDRQEISWKITLEWIELDTAFTLGEFAFSKFYFSLGIKTR